MFQVKRLAEEYHIFLHPIGRISISGLNAKNVEYVTEAIFKVNEFLNSRSILPNITFEKLFSLPLEFQLSKFPMDATLVSTQNIQEVLPRFQILKKIISCVLLPYNASLLSIKFICDFSAFIIVSKSRFNSTSSSRFPISIR